MAVDGAHFQIMTVIDHRLSANTRVAEHLAFVRPRERKARDLAEFFFLHVHILIAPFFHMYKQKTNDQERQSTHMKENERKNMMYLTATRKKTSERHAEKNVIYSLRKGK